MMSWTSISIHAPRTGSDRPRKRKTSAPIKFQSTLPARGATWDYVSEAYGAYISIHAPRTGSDSLVKIAEQYLELFQSTLPARGATDKFRVVAQKNLHFNPRSPHGERLLGATAMPRRHYFNPRSPHGERRKLMGDYARHSDDFNPRSPHGERRPRAGC